MRQILRLLACGPSLTVETYADGVYYFSLTPPPASRYLVANVTVTNVNHTEIPFDYGEFSC